MKTLQIDSLQPLLADVSNFNRFMGRYFLSSVISRTDSSSRPVRVLTFSDASGDFKVYCNNPSLMETHLLPYSMVHIEASLQQRQGNAYYHCKNLLPCVDEKSIGNDLSALPRSLCPFPEAVDALIVFTSRLHHPAMRQFLRQVLLQPNIGLRYLQCPASLRYHHNYPGGLIQHSVEVAWDIAGIRELSPFEQDIAVVAALLHDIGKTLTLTPDGTRTAIGSLVDHDQLTLEICAEPLKLLESIAPAMAHQLRHAWTCYSPKARYGFTPKTRVAKHLQRVDGMSANNSKNTWSVPNFASVHDVLRKQARVKDNSLVYSKSYSKGAKHA
ncbi:HD domain-containing protein [Paraglaciecola sp.]|uniref:HD domain-containing protein n=1 Tax=Paraglaciecola sp. TaxID=1920173 RepID=UPI003EF79E59